MNHLRHILKELGAAIQDVFELFREPLIILAGILVLFLETLYEAFALTIFFLFILLVFL